MVHANGCGKTGLGYTYATAAAAQSEVARRPMVNWDVVGRNWHVLTERVRYGWNRLSAG